MRRRPLARCGRAPSTVPCSGRSRDPAGASCAPRSTSCCCASRSCSRSAASTTRSTSRACSAPLLALPPLVLVLFYLRGLYRTRLRALILDGVVPVVSAVSVGAMAVAVLGMYLNDQVPSQSDWLRAWVFALIGVGLGRVALSLLQRWARARRLVGKPVLIMGAGVVGAQVARRLESHPEYGLAPVGFLDEDPRSIAEVGGRDVPVLGTIEDLDETVRQHRRHAS